MNKKSPADMLKAKHVQRLKVLIGLKHDEDKADDINEIVPDFEQRYDEAVANGNEPPKLEPIDIAAMKAKYGKRLAAPKVKKALTS